MSVLEKKAYDIVQEEYKEVVDSLQEEVDRRFRCLQAKSESPYL